MVMKGVYNPKLKLPLIPLSDGAGEVIATGAGATRFKPGERVVASFMPAWVDGPLDETKARSALGADVGGMLAEDVVLPEAGFLEDPSSPQLRRSGNVTMCRADSLARIVRKQSDQARPHDLDPRHGRCFAVRTPVRANGRRSRHRDVRQ